RQHRGGEGIARLGRRVDAMDHPVLLAPTGPKQRIAPAQALAGELDDDLLRLPLLDLEGAAVPDPHRPGAVLPGRYLTLELEVLERMVLGVDGFAVFVGIGGDPV